MTQQKTLTVEDKIVKAEQSVAEKPVRIRVTQLSKEFRSRAELVKALDSVSLEVRDGECVAILGPSGSGKTTLLRCIAGLETPTSGTVEINGRTMFSSSPRKVVPPESRGTAMVFQSYALWPHMSVLANVAYPLKAQGIKSASEIKARAMEALSRVNCESLARRYPAQLSGGQQQRVAVARAVVSGSPVILFDEPLSSVDLRVRESLRLDLLNLQRDLGFASVYVTHDQSEATVLGHTVAVMNQGRIEQVAPPMDVYNRPATPFVSKFVGSANWLDVTHKSHDGTMCLYESMAGTVSAPAEECGSGELIAAFRPENVSYSAERPDDARFASNSWPATIVNILFLGAYLEYVMDVNGARLVLRTPRVLEGVTEGATGWISTAAANVRIMEAQK